MSNWHLSRRTFLRGAGVALALPLLDVMTPRAARAAAQTAPPTRLGCIYLPNGIPFDAWKPVSSNGRVTRMNRWLSAFEPFRGDVQFLTGLQSDSNQTHQAASATWLVRPCPEGERINQTRNVGGVSMDQLVAQAVGDQTLVPSLELITRPEGTNARGLLLNNISWRRGNTPVPRETNPRAVFDRLTRSGSAGGDSPAASPRRTSVLDAVLEDARRLRGRISRDDRFKVDEYLDAIRGVERQMGAAAAAQRDAVRTRAATLPAPPAAIPDDHAAYVRLLFDMLVLAWWTDATRVSTFMLDHEETNRFVDFIPGVKGMWHSLSHWKQIEAGGDNFDGTSWTTRDIKYEQYLKVIRFHHEQVAYFLGRLRDIPEGDGTLLDHAMILYGSPFADGHDHQSTQLPMLIAGRAGGRIRPGRVLDAPERPAEGVYLSMMDALGVPVQEIGGIDEAVPIT